jgi:benzil reductase ((S)-benzoin forming)
MDLTDLGSVRRAVAGVCSELETFRGRTVILIHNACYVAEPSLAGNTSAEVLERSLVSNVVASIALCDGFLSCVRGRPDLDAGLVYVSSGAATFPSEGLSLYCAAKAGVEQWFRVARRERQRAGEAPWMMTVRPGLVNTPLLQQQADADPATFPLAPHVAQWKSAGSSVWTPEEAAREIWAAMTSSERPELIDLADGPRH